MDEWLLALLVGLVQGVFEWLPVSSEGSVALVLAVVGNATPDAAVRFALFLHGGTAVAAAIFYRGEIAALLRRLPTWRPGRAFDAERADLTFLVVATLASGAVGAVAYLALEGVASELSGGAFVAVIGALLVGTGLVQRTADARAVQQRRLPDTLDALLVGALQGLALLPGVSRSGTTVSALLLRGHEGEAALRLSFLLSIPAAAGAGLLVLVDEGLPAISPGAAVLALAVSAVVGYLTVDALVRLVERVAFWGVCVGFGLLAVVGGGLLVL